MNKEQEFIKEQTDKYYKILEDCDNEINDFHKMIDLTEKHYPKTVDNTVGDFIMIVRNNLLTSVNLKKIINKQLIAIQYDCEHNMEYDGSDSHYTYEKCKYCGTKDRT